MIAMDVSPGPHTYLGAPTLTTAAFFSAGLLVGSLSSRINPGGGGGRPLDCIWVRPGASRIGGVGLVCVQVRLSLSLSLRLSLRLSLSLSLSLTLTLSLTIVAPRNGGRCTLV